MQCGNIVSPRLTTALRERARRIWGARECVARPPNPFHVAVPLSFCPCACVGPEPTGRRLRWGPADGQGALAIAR